MEFSRLSPYRFPLYSVAILIGLLMLSPMLLSQAAPLTAPDPVSAAWERVHDAGSYHFTSDVVQITIPTAKITNVGRPSRTEQLYLEGRADLNAAALEFRLWTDGGSVHTAESALSVRAADGKSYTRQGTGDWQESSSFSDVIAPEGDFMAYLAAARDITSHEPETRAGITFTRYSFQIDGPTFAAFARNQMEAAARARGELPNGVHFEVSSYFHNMTGDGELWVRDNGLPLRQLLNIRFPEQNDESIQAQIKVDFSHFGQTRFVGGEFVQIDSASTGGSFAGVADTLQRNTPDFGYLLTLFAIILGLAVLVIRYRRARAVQVAIPIAVITSMLVGPLLNTLNLTTFFNAQTARAAEQRATLNESAMLSELSAPDSAPQFSPHQNLLEAATAAPELSPSMAASAAPANAPLLQTMTVLTVETGLDTDGDGLTDFVEQRIGTSLVLTDTDGDLISDKVEVTGFPTNAGTANEKKWYPNPFAVDSNDDGIADTLEYDLDGNGQPDDTDGDGTPDLFDNDNDDDGVPDRMDLAPFVKSSATLGESTPLLLKVNNLTVQNNTAVPTFVDFQIRPVSAQHLQIATSLLDWPQDDKGQVQDIDDQPSDMKLIPMLEIRIPNGAAMLPPESDLEPYGISVGNDEVPDRKVAYVPLNPVTDPQSGERVAFSGRMLYLPQAAWNEDHSVRMVWVVQVDNDIACDPSNAEDIQNGCAPDKGYFLNQPQIVHRYYEEDWILTGLNVIEEHGTDMAIVYEDPGVRSANDGAMWLLTSVLGERFLTATDDGNGPAERVVTMGNIETELDRTSNNGVTLYGLPNNFRVVKAHYATFDEAMYKVGSETTKSVLNTTFTNSNQKPLLLYAYETNLRSMGLDASRLDNSANSYASFTGALLTMNFDPPGNQPNTSVETTAGFKWTPYCGGNGMWDVCDPVAYWQELEARHGADYLDPDTLQLVSASSIDPDVAEGEMVATQLYALSMLQGFNALVMRDAQPVTGLYTSEDDNELITQVAKGLLLGSAVARWAANREILKGLTSFTRADGSSYSHSELIKRVRLGRIDNRGTFSTIGRFPTALKYGAYGAMGLVLAGTAVAAGLALAGYEEAEIPAQVGIGAITLAATVLVPMRTVYIATQETGKTAAQVLLGLSSDIGYTQKAGAIGAGLAILVTWGVFFASVAVNKMVAFGPEFNSALADTIASTILIIYLAIFALNPIGLIIVGLIAVVDIILLLICEYGGVDSRNDFTGGCFTISGAATKVIAYALYNYELMINTSKKDLVTFGAPDVTLANPNLGYAEDNHLSLTLPITTHAVHKDPEVEQGLYINFYLWLFSKDNLRSSTFKYSATQPDKEDISGLERFDIASKWFNVREDHKYVLTPMYGGFYTTTVTVGNIPLQAGLNQPAKFYHNMGFAIPAYECWVVPNPLTVPVPVCYTRTFKNKTSEPVETIVFDIFPASLDAFIALGNKNDGGKGLAWDDAFRSLQDADGDGLLASRYGGLDPNDTTWDTDGDGLADSFELELRQAGVNLSPELKDSDGDGLTDAQERQFGTNPGVADSDNDGLLDGEEVWHQNMNTGVWEGGLDVRINSQPPRTVRVSSNPNARDSDGDGVSDGAEYQLAGNNGVDGNGKLIRLDDNNVPYHPNVVNTPPVRIYVTSDAVNNRYVTPSQQFVYTTTVVATAPLADGVLDQEVRNISGALDPLLGVTSQRYGLSFSTSPTVTQQTNFTVASTAQTQMSVTVNSGMRALLAGSGPGPWQLVSPLEGNFWESGSIGRPPRFTALAPTALGNVEAYQTVSRNKLSTSGAGTGQVWARDFPYTMEDQIDNDWFTRDISYRPGVTTVYTDLRNLHTQNSPEIACNDGGTCMAVWDYIDTCSTVTIDSLTVDALGGDAGGGLEPIVYLVRESNSDFDPKDGGYEVLWSARYNYGDGVNNVPKGTLSGSAHDFPVSMDICNGGAIVVYESDDQDVVDNHTLNKWNDQSLLGRFDLPREGGFWEEQLSDTLDVPFDSGCGGCSITLKITNPSRQIHKVAGALIKPDGSVQTQFDLSSFDQNRRTVEFYRPTVATNGSDFLVAWERSILQRGLRNLLDNNVENAIITRRFAANGDPLGNNTLVTASGASTTRTTFPIESQARAQLALNWVGDRYLLTRLLSPSQVNATGEWAQGITIRDLDSSGQIVAGTSVQQLIGTARTGIDDNYDWDYDPINNRGLITYFDPGNRLKRGLFQPTGNGTYMVTTPQGLDLASSGDAGSPQVEYEPVSKGWVVGWTGGGRPFYNVLDAEATVQIGQIQIPDSFLINSNALACPAPQSQPLVDLRFEEIPGATTFEDDSGYGNDASCTTGTCPALGAEGAPQAPRSAYALEFNNANNKVLLTKPSQLNGSFSLAFWYKAKEAAFFADPFVIESNQPSGFGLFVRNDQNQVEWHVANKSVGRAAIADNQWHFIVGTYDRSTGAVNLYVDGNRVGQGATATQAPVLGPNIEMRGANTLVGIDHLQIYPSALSPSTVSTIFGRSNNPFCLGTSGSAATVPGRVHWQKLALTRSESFPKVTADAASIITVDNDAPTAAVTGAQYVDIDDSGSTILTIGGTAQDPTSGVGSVAVSVNNGAYQPATGRESWVYQFPVTEGAYTIRAQATDVLGHVGDPSAGKVIIADATPPQVTINAITNPVKPVLNGDGNWQVSLSGTAVDPNIGAHPGSGVNADSVQVLLTGAGGAAVSDQWQTASYNTSNNQWTINYVFPAARLDVTGVYTVSVRAEDRAGSNGGNNTGDNGATAVLQLDHTGPSAALSTTDAARQLITEPVTIGGPVTSPLSGIAKVEVAFASVEDIAALGSDVSAEDAQTQLDTDNPNRWSQAALVQQGAGITSTTWSLVLPADLEGEYQIDLRGTDVLGNVLVSPKAWRGIIDLQAPRVSIVRTESGWGNTSNTGVRFEHVMYKCVAADRYLVAGAFSCPGVTLSSLATRGFNTDPLLQSLFPDRTLLDRMEFTTYRFEPSSPPESVTACDLFGKCSTASTGQTVAAAQRQVMAAASVTAVSSVPQALVVSPIEGHYVASNGDLPVTIAAEAEASLQQVTLEIDGNLVQTLSFAQTENVTRTQRTVTIPNVTEGAHILVAKATDWDNIDQATLYPVAFTLDLADPAVTLDTDLLRLADTWALGSDMLRFNGTAGDSVGLAAVQIKIGDAPYVEAGFDESNDTWSTAQLVPDPQGKTLAVTVRAIDRAGRIAAVSGNIGVDLTPTEVTITPPDTTITPTVVNASVNSVEVSFAGVPGTNEVAAFECRLDEGPFQPCVSPQQFDDLNNGVNHFEVRAIDDQGFVDSTPASEDWTIAFTTLQVTITEKPGDPTFSRDATFVFTGATSYECSLDGAAYTACNATQSYAGLSDGMHTLLVRGLDGSGGKGAATRFTWRVENAAPVVTDQSVTTFRDMAVDITLTGSDADALTYQLLGNPTHGVAQFIAADVVRYTPDSDFAGLDSFTFWATDGQLYSDPATVTILVNYEPVITVDPAAQAVQFSDGIVPVTVTVDDLDSSGNALEIVSTTWSDGANSYPGLPDQLTLTRVSDNDDTVPGQAVWTLAGAVDLPVGAYVITLIADDGVGGSITGDPMEIAIEVAPEDVMVRFHGGNPRAVQVANAGDANSGSFELRVDVKELYPDNGALPLPGDIARARADLSMQLVPIGPGGPADPIDCATELHDVDYDARLTFTCSFDTVPINTYAVAVTVGGDYYAGFDEDVVTVYDPSLGFTTGGGAFDWPGTTDETSFGFTIEYNKKGKNVQGRLMLIRRLEDGTVYRIKSNALEGLALGEEDDFTWASFNGKATYQAPDMDVAEGNYTFVVYVEDRETGDRFWLEVKDKDGVVILPLSMVKPAQDYAVTVKTTSGDIAVPGGGSAQASSAPVDHPGVDELADEDQLSEEKSTDVPATLEDETVQEDEGNSPATPDNELGQEGENSTDEGDGQSRVYFPIIGIGSPAASSGSTDADVDGKEQVYLPVVGSGD